MSEPRDERSPVLPVLGTALLASVLMSTPEGRARARERQKPFARVCGILALLLLLSLLWPADKPPQPLPPREDDAAEAAAPLPPPAWPTDPLAGDMLPLDLHQGQAATDDALSSPSQ